MSKFQLKITGIGLLVTGKSISSQQSNFWSNKSYSELSQYLNDGDDEFDEFPVPKNAKFSGILAEDETDLKIDSSDEFLKENLNLVQIYGPKLDQIKNIELWNVDDHPKLIWSKDQPQILTLPSSENDDEDICVYLKVADHNLLYLESEKGFWTFEFESSEGISENDPISAITTNCSFTENIDEILDGVCVAFVIRDCLARLVDADTENLGTLALIYDD